MTNGFFKGIYEKTKTGRREHPKPQGGGFRVLLKNASIPKIPKLDDEKLAEALSTIITR